MNNISNTIPQIYETLHKQFGVEWDKGLVITYFPHIHVKSGHLPPDLEAHESTHLYQQEHYHNTSYGNGSAGWWKQYLEDPRFRLQEETAAYMVQVEFIRKNLIGRNNRRAHFKHILNSFVKMYGGIVTKEQAKQLLKI